MAQHPSWNRCEFEVRGLHQGPADVLQSRQAISESGIYRKRVDASGEMDEIAFGSCGVHALKWLVMFLLGVIFAFFVRVDPTTLPLWRLILRLLALA